MIQVGHKWYELKGDIDSGWLNIESLVSLESLWLTEIYYDKLKAQKYLIKL